MKTILITGANRGIGLEFCRQLKAQGNKVIAACRKSSSELDNLAVQVETGVDVTDPASLQNLNERLAEETIDVLINNAGILSVESLDNLNLENIRQQFEVNTLGPLNTVNALFPRLSSSAKIILITSRMGSIADNTSGSSYGYRMSKAALNIAGVSLACDLKDRGIAVALLHPGYVKTEMTRNMGDLTTKESVKGLIARIDQLTLENTGTFWHTNGEELKW